MTLDYKGLLLLLAKIDDEDFLLGGHGLAAEFCIYCTALRVSLFYYSQTSNIDTEGTGLTVCISGVRVTEEEFI